jgi:hypothetical protein
MWTDKKQSAGRSLHPGLGAGESGPCESARSSRHHRQLPDALGACAGRRGLQANPCSLPRKDPGLARGCGGTDRGRGQSRRSLAGDWHSSRGVHGIPPTGKSATWTGITFYRFEGGTAAEERGEKDALGLMRQLGMIRAWAQAAGRVCDKPAAEALVNLGVGLTRYYVCI